MFVCLGLCEGLFTSWLTGEKDHWALGIAVSVIWEWLHLIPFSPPCVNPCVSERESGWSGFVLALQLLSQSCLDRNRGKKWWRHSHPRCCALGRLWYFIVCRLYTYFGGLCVWTQQFIDNCWENLGVFTFQIYPVFLELSVSLLSQLRKRATASSLDFVALTGSNHHKMATIFSVQSLIHHIIWFFLLKSHMQTAIYCYFGLKL